MRITASSATLLVLLSVVLVLKTVSAVGASSRSSTSTRETMDPLQVQILMNLTTTWPVLLNLTAAGTTSWSSEALSSDGCQSGVTGINSCNGTGWVAELNFDSRTPLVGSFPDALGDMQALTSLTFGETITSLSGTLPASWSKPRGLAYIRIQTPSIVGTIPASWSSLVNMNQLQLSWVPNSPVTAWPTGFLTNMTSLALLEIDNYNFGTTNALPHDLVSTPAAQVTLKGITFNGNVSSFFTPTPASLTSLTIDADPSVALLTATNALPSDMSAMAVNTLYLGYLPIRGPLPSVLPSPLATLTLANLPCLESNLSTGILRDSSVQLSLTMTGLPLVTGSIPAIGASICPAHFDRMGLTGTISSTLMNTSGLLDLQISNMPNMAPHALPEAPANCQLDHFNVYVGLIQSIYVGNLPFEMLTDTLKFVFLQSVLESALPAIFPPPGPRTVPWIPSMCLTTRLVEN